MPHVYILENREGRHYIGITSLNLESRLERHNRGDVYSTKLGRPWEIIYSEKFVNLSEARQKEKLLKSWKGGNAFKRFISKAAGSSNGRIDASGASYLGSSPSPAALEINRHKFGGVK